MTQIKDTQAQIAQVQKLMQAAKFDVALDRADVLLQSDPNLVDVLYMRAVCLRYLKRHDEAAEAIETLKSFVPEFGRAFQEQGHLYRAQGELDKALNAFQKAAQYNPALMASWAAQADLLAHFKAPQGEVFVAQRHVERLRTLPPELVAVMNYMSEKRVQKAEDLCRHFLRANPKNTEGMRLLANIAETYGAMDEAEFLLESAVHFAPDIVQLRLDYIQILRRRQKLQAALEQAEYIYNLDPKSPTFQGQMGVCHMMLGDFDKAISFYEKVVACDPRNFTNFTSLGHALKTAGRNEEGVKAYQKAYTVRPDHGEAYFSLANLKTYRFTDVEIAQMKAKAATPDLTYRDQVHFLFALGKAHEDKKLYEQAFDYYNRGNDLGRKLMRFDSAKMTVELNAQVQICTKGLFEKQKQKGCPAPDPIFIVGLPRAGSTLLEQIIASHSQVDGTQELGNILSIAHTLRGKGRTTAESEYPKNLHNLPGEKLKQLGERYIADTQIHRKGAPFFIDKMPNNFRHIALIKLILPNAKIIDARRHPMACCFSGFKQHFAEGQEFTYGLENIGKYYRDYVGLMDHWDAVLPGQILRVQYEDVVADTECQVRRILDYLGLPFEQACVDFHKNKRSVRTASSEQVRKPIFKSGLEQWKNFEPWLDPLKEALGPEIMARYPI